MKTSMELEQQLTLRLERETSQHLDEIITKMQKMAKEFKIADQEEKSPFRNVLNVAMEATTSLEVIKNFIRYQVGRQGSSKIWKESKNEEGQLFADAVVKQIDDLRTNTEQILLDTVGLNLEDLLKDSKEKEIISDLEKHLQKSYDTLLKSQHLKLTGLYLGYLSREHTALKEILSDLEKHLQKNYDTLLKSQHLKLTGLYLGYLSREHTALIEEKKQEKARQKNRR